MPTPRELLVMDVSGLAEVADRAVRIADAIVKVSNAMHTTIHDDLAWQGVARQAAGDKADREQTQMRAIATAYDDLGAACAGAARDLEHPIAEAKTILQHYAVPPVAVADDWTVTGVEDWDSEAGVQLSRLPALVDSLARADTTWSAAIAAANGELAALAPAAALAAANSAVQQDKQRDDRADPDRIRTSAAAFQQMFGRPPVTPTDWTTAEALNPKSYDPKYQGVDPAIRVVRIRPVPGQGVVRTSQYIEQRDVSNPFNGGDSLNPVARDRGDDRTAAADFDPEHARVTMYVDYENGIVVMRQNPSVEQNSDGSPGAAKVTEPEGRVWQNPDGSVRVQYSAANPFAPGISKNPPLLGDHAMTVNGDLVFSPGQHGVEINGTRTNYPSLEAYQDWPDGRTNTLVIDPAAAGNSGGPGMNLPFHHDLGPRGGSAFHAFDEPDGWNYQYDVREPGGPKPSTPFGPVGAAPSVPPVPIPKGMI
ncbi:hypothetical protein ACWDSJ_08355 [Nocardia sp. NPDC003482]